jgi:hypothetical protein
MHLEPKICSLSIARPRAGAKPRCLAAGLLQATSLITEHVRRVSAALPFRWTSRTQADETGHNG